MSLERMMMMVCTVVLSDTIASMSSSVKASVWSFVGGAIFVYVFSFWASFALHTLLHRRLLVLEPTPVTGFFWIFAIFVIFAPFAISYLRESDPSSSRSLTQSGRFKLSLLAVVSSVLDCSRRHDPSLRGSGFCFNSRIAQ